jgi:hypothetical protein
MYDKIANKFTAIEAREKISTDLESYEFVEINLCSFAHNIYIINFYLMKCATGF